MTPSKAKEIIEAFCKYAHFRNDEYVPPGDAFDRWATTPQAAALLSGEDWISVEKKPEKKEYYITFDPNYPEQPLSIGLYQPYSDTWENDFGDRFHPSHYQPSPEPPKTNGK